MPLQWVSVRPPRLHARTPPAHPTMRLGRCSREDSHGNLHLRKRVFASVSLAGARCRRSCNIYSFRKKTKPKKSIPSAALPPLPRRRLPAAGCCCCAAIAAADLPPLLPPSSWLEALGWKRRSCSSSSSAHKSGGRSTTGSRRSGV